MGRLDLLPSRRIELPGGVVPPHTCAAASREGEKHVIRRLGFALAVLALVSGAGLLLRAEPPQAVGTWASIGTAPENRIGAAAVALPDGRTLIVGGLAAEPPPMLLSSSTRRTARSQPQDSFSNRARAIPRHCSRTAACSSPEAKSTTFSPATSKSSIRPTDHRL